jgi:hypothetical protein
VADALAEQKLERRAYRVGHRNWATESHETEPISFMGFVARAAAADAHE